MDEFAPYWQRWLRHWHDMIDPKGPMWVDEYCAAGMINDLWADRKTLTACLAPLPKAPALEARILEVMDAVGPPDGPAPGLYFVVRNPYPASDAELEEWMSRYVRRARELTGELLPVSAIEVIRCDAPLDEYRLRAKSADDHIREQLADWVADAMNSRCTLEERAAYYALDEALYKMARDYELAGFVQWVFLEDHYPGLNPYRPHFDCWRSGAHECCVGERLLVFAPRN